MNHIDYIKGEIKRLYETDPNIHINVKMTHPKVNVQGTTATITGVYRNIFQIEETHSGEPKRHTVQYGDILIGAVVIEELDYVPVVSTPDKK